MKFMLGAKNLRSAWLAAVFVPVLLGCGISERINQSLPGSGGAAESNAAPVDNRSITDKAIGAAVGEEKVGIAECDAVIDTLAAQANNPDDGIFVKAAKATALSQFRAKLRQQLGNTNVNQAAATKFCRDFAAQIGNASQSNTNAKQ